MSTRSMLRARRMARLMVQLEIAARQAQLREEHDAAERLWLQRETLQFDRSKLLRTMWGAKENPHRP